MPNISIHKKRAQGIINDLAKKFHDQGRSMANELKTWSM